MCIDGSAYGSLDCAAPSTAWLVPIVPNEAATPALVWKTQTIALKGESFNLTLEIGTLVPDKGLCPAVTMNDKHYAVLKRGLLYPDCVLNCLALFTFPFAF